MCYKDKLALIQERETEEFQDLVKNIEAAHLINESSFVDQSRKAELSIIDEDEDDDGDVVMMNEEQKLTNDKVNEVSSQEMKDDNQEADEISQDLSNSDDSLDRLIRKYDSKAADKRKKDKKVNQERTQEKKSTISKPITATVKSFDSPVSTVTLSGKQFKKFKSFNAISHVAGPSFASSPISKFLDVETSASRRNLFDNDDDDEFDRLVAKYNVKEVLPSPIVPAKRKAIATAVVAKKPALKQVPLTFTKTQVQTQVPTPSQPELEQDKDDDFDYISIDDINPHDYEIHLLIDTAESKASANEIIATLREHSVRNEIRKLHVGDFLWIAKHKTQKSKELVLPYIVERKRVDDLSSSIKDGRFHEQKFRLKQCGLENVIYLIENYMKGGKVQCSLPFTTLLQAATNTQIQNKFSVKFSESIQHTGMYLAIMTSFIDNIFRNKKPIKYKMLDFTTFNQSSVKQKKLTVRETFIKQLLALKGLSVDIALEITKVYPTPSDLYNKYLTMSTSEGEALLSKLTMGELKRKVPLPVSKVIYHFYMHK